MNFPLSIYAEWSQYTGLVVAFVIGIGFGFMLERAGFGSARKLAAQFYLRDFAVLKVMFTAIVVAAVGFWAMVLVGLADISLTFVNPTFIWSQIIGGLILGVGFIVGGYCPGTSCVAAATGKLDAFYYLGGVLFGILVYGEFQTSLQTLQNAGSMGVKYVWQWLGVSPGVVVLLASVMAVGAFTWGTSVERKKNSVVEPL